MQPFNKPIKIPFACQTALLAPKAFFGLGVAWLSVIMLSQLSLASPSGPQGRFELLQEELLGSPIADGAQNQTKHKGRLLLLAQRQDASPTQRRKSPDVNRHSTSQGVLCDIWQTQLQISTPLGLLPELQTEEAGIFKNFQMLDHLLPGIFSDQYFPSQVRPLSDDHVHECQSLIQLFLNQLILQDHAEALPSICSKHLSESEVIALATAAYWIKVRVFSDTSLPAESFEIFISPQSMSQLKENVKFVFVAHQEFVIYYKPSSLGQGSNKQAKAIFCLVWSTHPKKQRLTPGAFLEPKDPNCKKIRELFFEEYCHFCDVRNYVDKLQKNTLFQKNTPLQKTELADFIAPYRPLGSWLPQHNTSLYFLQPLYQGNLKSKIGSMNLATALRYAKKITQATHIIHASNTIHSDLTPNNILVGYQGEVVISDFGLAFRKHLESFLGGTIRYMPAEAELDYKSPRHYENPPEKIDVFSIGVIFLQMFIPFMTTDTTPPLLSQLQEAEIQQIDDGAWGSAAMWQKKLHDHQAMQTLSQELFDKLTADGKQELAKLARIIRTCVDLLPKKRPTINEIICQLNALELPLLFSQAY